MYGLNETLSLSLHEKSALAKDALFSFLLRDWIVFTWWILTKRISVYQISLRQFLVVLQRFVLLFMDNYLKSLGIEGCLMVSFLLREKTNVTLLNFLHFVSYRSVVNHLWVCLISQIFFHLMLHIIMFYLEMPIQSLQR